MTRIAIALLAAASAPALLAQANTVAGLDGRVSAINDLTYWGRLGSAYPNGEVAMSMLVDICNPGSVNLPWQSAMAANHCKQAFMICRVAGGRIEQISDRSHCRHVAVAANAPSPCGACVSPGTGQLLGVGCLDSSSASSNGDRYWLGPATETDPWLGVWSPIGSYFDRGDPAAGGPAASDGVRSLSAAQTGAFDAGKNRIRVRETDLAMANATYWYGAQLVVQGEAVANRGNNLISRGFTPTWSGAFWTFANNTQTSTQGTILSRWPGAVVNAGQNGSDDGRFFVASVVTPLGNGHYHYEYAVHNADNSRGAGSFRVPVPVAATVTNTAFGDIDTDPQNDWVAAVVGAEIVFTAPSSNPLDWNTIYNFSFDCDAPSGSGATTFDAARSGPGQAVVSVATRVPGGATIAAATTIGSGCGGTSCYPSFYELFTPASSFDLANSQWALTLQAGNYVVGPSSVAYATPAGTAVAMGDDVESPVTLPFWLPGPGGSTNTLWIGSNGFVSPAPNGVEFDPTVASLLAGQRRWAALWHDLVPATGQVLFESTPTVARISFTGVPNFSGGGTSTFQYQFFPNGSVHVIYQSIATAGNNYLVGFGRGGGTADPGSWDVSAQLAGGLTLCTTQIPTVGLTASARPLLGTNITLNTFNIPIGSLLGLSILSTNQLSGIDLTGLGMPGCRLFAGLDSITQFPTPFLSASVPLALPNTPSLAGAEVMSQSATLTPNLNAFGFAVSNGLLLLLGTL